MLDALAELNQSSSPTSAIRRSHTRIAQYEMAFRMQTSVPELIDISERAEARARPVRPRTCTSPARSPPMPAGPPAGRAGRALRADLPPRLGPARQSAARDPRPVPATPTSPPPALIKDLKQRGMLDDTLVDLGRRVRPHRLFPGQAHARRITAATITRAASRMWLAGGGIKPGMTLRRDRRLQLQHRQGSGPRPRPERHDPALPGHRPQAADLRFQGRDFRLTDVHGEVVRRAVGLTIAKIVGLRDVSRS